MPQFFIKRPVFAWVIAIAILLVGAISLDQLPVSRFPTIAPPTISIYASYPGASAQTTNDTVVNIIERELTSVHNLLYFESSVDTSGSATITATFQPGTDPDMAQVDVQNRLKSVEPRLPSVVRQNGVTIEGASSGFLMMVELSSEENRFTPADLGDYMTRNVVPELRRINGVGRVQNFGTEKAMRIWVDPVKLRAHNLTFSDITTAITNQNAQVTPSAIGAEPTVKGQRVTVPLTVEGQLKTPEEFARIVLAAKTNGAKVLLGDVATVAIGTQDYSYSMRSNGRLVSGVGVQLATGANAVRTAQAVTERLQELQKTMPQGMRAEIPFNTVPFIRIAIEKVIHTLFEAMILVFAVMYLFLQRARYTIIPAIVVPIALLGSCAVLYFAGYSINVLTMFGMVLAIGIIVDDAIVVVENVERIMTTEGLPPKEATKKAMKEITGAVIGITLVLTAVFIPMAFMSGSVGVIYRQFSVSMASSIILSAFLALTLTPALCATILKQETGHQNRNRFFNAFNSWFQGMTARYNRLVAWALSHRKAMLVSFALILVALAIEAIRLPSAFFPEEDQGYFMTSIQLPADATVERTNDTVRQFEKYMTTRPGIDITTVVQGFSFSGSGTNMALAFTTLKDWNDRHGATAEDETLRTNIAMAELTREGTIMSVMPPSVDDLGNASGFSMRLQDRGNGKYEDLIKAQNLLLQLAAQSKLVKDVYPESLMPGPGIRITIDRDKARAMGVTFDEINSTLSAALGSSYVNDFPNNGRMQQVIVQADAKARMQIGDILKLNVKNDSGTIVPISEFVTVRWEEAPRQMIRYNGYPALRISGSAATGVSSGEAMQEMERLASKLPSTFSVSWTAQSLQEKLSGSQAPILLGLSMVVVFLVLAALYESWIIPISVLLVVPLGLLGALSAVMICGMSNDVFFKVGLITIIGLTAKNAILIVEFTKQAMQRGKGLMLAVSEAASLRLRPIIMTSLAFTLGVVPLMLASGASKETQQSIGTGVFGGMLTATGLVIVFVPVFFVVVFKSAAWIRLRIATFKFLAIGK